MHSLRCDIHIKVRDITYAYVYVYVLYFSRWKKVTTIQRGGGGGG